MWGGISKKGATKAVIISGIMDAEKHTEILKRGLLPFVEARFPHGNMIQNILAEQLTLSLMLTTSTGGVRLQSLCT